MAESENKPLLSLRKIAKRFQNGNHTITVLSEISFDLQAGESCSVIGPSGSGKSTLLAVAAGLDAPSEGQVTLDGEDLMSLDEEGRAALRLRAIGFVFQNFQLVPTLTALENVALPAELRGRDGDKEAAELLSQVGLADRLRHYPAQLSGGEQQRVALARAFINKPRIIFADEPTGNLDRETAERASEIMFSLNRDFNTALLLVTHDAELAARTERKIVLRGGAMV